MKPEWKQNMHLPGIHHQDIRPSEEPWLFPPDSGGKCDSIEYEIQSLRVASSGDPDEAPFTGLTIATVLVKVATVKRAKLIGTTVDVVDHSGCVFDLPQEDLVGVWGWGSWRVAESLDPAAGPGELTPPHFSADDRCCAGAENA